MQPASFFRFTFLLGGVLTCAVAGAAQETTAPAGPLAPLVEGEKLKIVVTAIEGRAQYRLPDQKDWRWAEVGQRFEEGVEFRTGLRNTLQFLIEPQEYVRVDRNTAAKVLRANVENGLLKSNIGMTYGRLSSQVDVAGRPHESLVMSPNGALAHGGTGIEYQDSPGFAPQAGVVEGRARVSHVGATPQLLGEKGKQNNVRLKQGRPSAAETALEARTVDPSIAFARTGGEDRLVQYVLNSGATVDFDRRLNLPVVRGGTVPRADADLVPILPGVLNFVLRWDGNANLNFGLNGPSGELIYPAEGFNRTPSGGRIPFDHRGGPNGGYEVIYWRKETFPSGSYGPFIQNVNGPTVNATVDVFRNGQRLDLTYFNPDNGQEQTLKTVSAVIPEETRKDVIANVPIRVQVSRR